METLQELIEKREKLNNELSELDKEISKISDGFVYFLVKYTHGTLRIERYKNAFTVKQWEYFYGDECSVRLYSNNPNFDGIFIENITEQIVREREDKEKGQDDLDFGYSPY